MPTEAGTQAPFDTTSGTDAGNLTDSDNSASPVDAPVGSLPSMPLPTQPEPPVGPSPLDEQCRQPLPIDVCVDAELAGDAAQKTLSLTGQVTEVGTGYPPDGACALRADAAVDGTESSTAWFKLANDVQGALVSVTNGLIAKGDATVETLDSGEDCSTPQGEVRFAVWGNPYSEFTSSLDSVEECPLSVGCNTDLPTALEFVRTHCDNDDATSWFDGILGEFRVLYFTFEDAGPTYLLFDSESEELVGIHIVQMGGFWSVGRVPRNFSDQVQSGNLDLFRQDPVCGPTALGGDAGSSP